MTCSVQTTHRLTVSPTSRLSRHPGGALGTSTTHIHTTSHVARRKRRETREVPSTVTILCQPSWQRTLRTKRSRLVNTVIIGQYSSTFRFTTLLHSLREHTALALARAA